MKMRVPATFLAALIALLGMAPFVAAQTAAPAGAQRATSRSGSVAFTYRDEKIIRDYFAAYPGEPEIMPIDTVAPPLAKGQRLRSNLPRRPLPRDLAIRLKPLPRGYERLIIDNDLVVLATRTGTIVDVILDAW